jgi:Xaa-Pro aminopeptidase
VVKKNPVMLNHMNAFNERVSRLREAMNNTNTDAYIIPTADPHLGEYIPDYWRIIQWLTGFSGSAATVVVTDSFAGLWTDSRYLIQAEKELHDSGFSLVSPGLPDYAGWIAENLREGSRVGLDGNIFSTDQIRKIEKAFEGKNLNPDYDCDLISELWTDRPELPQSRAFDHSTDFCGKDRASKICELREEMKLMKADYHLLTSPDDIMWLLNIRGNDFRYSPLIMSFAIADEDQILLFAEENKFPLKIASEFDKLGIVMLPYEETAGMLSTISSGSSILLNPSTTSVVLYNSVPPGVRIIEDISIPARLKSIKNSVEKDNIRKTMIKDGVALTRFFYWMEQNRGSEQFSELSLGKMVSDLRAENENYLGPAFSPIVAFREHGAAPHYSATKETDMTLTGDGILLVDSGGQYLGGTTDITRTIALGRPADKQKRDFTLVLKGMIDLAAAVFPEGTKGYQLDFLARKALWENGLNYGHGTGHGVGFCLNVHEGPQNIGPGSRMNQGTAIEPGMLISDEPAIYRVGEYGIRIENLILCCEDAETDFGKFLKFETVSLCYIDKSLIDVSLLDQKEIDWLNSYHAEVFEKLSPFLNDAERLWLKDKTSGL